MEEEEPWLDGWHERFNAILLRHLGYVNTAEYVRDSRGQSFGEMFQAIVDAAGPEGKEFLTFAHLEIAYYRESHAAGRLREAMMESLARSFRQLMPRGRNFGDRPEERRVEVRMHWPIPRQIEPRLWTYDEWVDLQKAVMAKIEQLAPPDPWCPANGQDAVLVEAFRHAWPAE